MRWSVELFVGFYWKCYFYFAFFLSIYSFANQLPTCYFVFCCVSSTSLLSFIQPFIILWKLKHFDWKHTQGETSLSCLVKLLPPPPGVWTTNWCATMAKLFDRGELNSMVKNESCNTKVAVSSLASSYYLKDSSPPTTVLSLATCGVVMLAHFYQLGMPARRSAAGAFWTTCHVDYWINLSQFGSARFTVMLAWPGHAIIGLEVVMLFNKRI